MRSLQDVGGSGLIKEGYGMTFLVDGEFVEPHKDDRNGL